MFSHVFWLEELDGCRKRCVAVNVWLWKSTLGLNGTSGNASWRMSQ